MSGANTMADTIRSSIYGVQLPERPKLLVVDDEPVNIEILYEVFKEDHEVLMATGGEQAIDACRRAGPDLILLDVVMPRMDGLEVCRKLKQDPALRDIPVIFVTSQHSPDEEESGLRAGAVDFIAKPVTPAVVRARVKTQLLLKAQSDLLRAMAFIDGLTGVPNRRQFDDRVDIEWGSARRNGSSVAVVMIDIDHFKLYNDRYGHQQGDACLRNVASALQEAINRPRDLLARYGGEEFACLLPECDAAGALTVGRKAVETVAALKLPHDASETTDIVTISAGIAAAIPGPDATPEDLLAAADHQLYRAKLRGRNTVEGKDRISVPGESATAV